MRYKRLFTLGRLLPKQALYQAEPRPVPTVARVLSAFGQRGNAAERERNANIGELCVATVSHSRPPDNVAGSPHPPCGQCHGSGWHLRCALGVACHLSRIGWATNPVCSPACRFGTCDRCGGSGKEPVAGSPPPLRRSIAGCVR
jgi:hypothetical protein